MKFKIVEYIPKSIALFSKRAAAEDLLSSLREDNPEFRYEIHKAEMPREWYLARYPRICAHIICESLGYATPTVAAMILKDADERKENWCEWIYSCYDKNPLLAVQGAIYRRHHHTGYMAEYQNAIALVNHAIETGKEPLLGSWF